MLVTILALASFLLDLGVVACFVGARLTSSRVCRFGLYVVIGVALAESVALLSLCYLMGR